MLNANNKTQVNKQSFLVSFQYKQSNSTVI